jgi:hypothetical protein
MVDEFLDDEFRHAGIKIGDLFGEPFHPGGFLCPIEPL